ncbi:MAG: NAD(P)/FAD-dependent oxidoreductase [Chloroflexi bacterium]|nr:NAD(P)/FAD-dependent oxidoreductase [Chloroflexota bacterium]MCY3938707.1 NAD(P)/FAD-dependent oxidoreductase [Chloroflexota bacterium]
MATRNAYDVVMIGAGHNGLVASFYLARAGLSVLILEAGEQVGGACITEELFPGYLHESCAQSFYALQPEILRDTRLVERGLRGRTGGVGTHLYLDGRSLTLTGDESNDFDQIAQFSVHDAGNYAQWHDFVERASRLLQPYIMKPPVSLARIFADYQGTSDEALLSRLVTTSMGQLMGDFFESDEILAAMWNPADLGSLWETGSGFGFALSRAVSRREIRGVTKPGGTIVGGIGQVTRLLAEAAEEEGVEILTASPVSKILVESGGAAGVELVDGDRIAARTVVSSADPKRTFLNLLTGSDLEAGFLRRVRNLRAKYGCLKFLCTLSELPVFYATEHLDTEWIAGGGIRVRPSTRYRDLAWEDVWAGRLPRAPMLAIAHPSISDPSRAPAGKHTGSWYIEFAPHRLAEGTWDERREEMADRLLDIIDQYSPNYRSAIIDYKLVTPLDLERDRLLSDGNIHHIDVIPSQMLDQRPLPELSQYRAPIKDLYLCGAGMHPWGEVNGAPGHNAANQILRDLNQPKLRLG